MNLSQGNNKERLNRLYHNKKRMELAYKGDYKALKHYINTTRVDLLKEKQDGYYKIAKDQEERLLRLGYIDWKEYSKSLYHPQHIVTIEGNKRYLELKSIWQKDWTFWIAVGAFILGLINLYLYLKSNILIRP